MKFRLSLFVYSLICDIPVSFFLCLASAISAQSDFEAGVLTISFVTIDWMNMLTNFVIALILSLIISIPMYFGIIFRAVKCRNFKLLFWTAIYLIVLAFILIFWHVNNPILILFLLQPASFYTQEFSQRSY